MPVSARREAAIGITVDPSKMDAGVEGARRKMRKMRKDIEDDEEGGGRKRKKKEKPFGHDAGNFITGAVRQLGARATDGILGAMSDAASSTFNVEKALVRLQIVGNMSGEQLDTFRQKLGEVSNQTGLTKQDILDGTSAYVDLTGDVAGATKGMSAFARIAQASDSSMASVTSAAASMMDAMHVKPEDFEAVFSGLINQGKQGAVTLKNMAGEFPELLTRFARFGELGNNGTLELGAMFQVVRKGFGSAEEAGTGLKGLMDGLKKHADRFAKGGVQVFDVSKDGTKTFRPLSQILTQLENSKLVKDPQAVSKAFGRGEGEQAYNMLTTHLDLLRQLEEAGQDAGTVERDLATYSQSSAGRIELAWNAVKNKFAEAFTPDRIAGFAAALEDVLGVLGKIGSVVGDIFASWQQMRENTHDVATGSAEETAHLSAKEQDYAAAKNEQAAAKFDPYMEGAQNATDSWWSGLVDPIGINRSVGNATIRGHDILAETGAKQRRQASANRGRTNEADWKNLTSAGSGDFDAANPYGQSAGDFAAAIGKSVAAELAKAPINISVNANADGVKSVVQNAPSVVKQRPRS